MARFELKLPKMGESVAEATITSWLKEVGDTIEADEAVLEIATDKVDSEVPSEVDGILVEKRFNADDVVQVGQVIAVIETEGEAGASAEAPKAQDVVEETTAAVAEVSQTVVAAKEAAAPISSNGDRFYSPLVKNMAKAEGIAQAELDRVPGTGKEGRVTKADMQDYLKSRGAQPAKAAGLGTAIDPAKTQTAPKSEPKKEAAPVVASGGDEIIEMTENGQTHCASHGRKCANECSRAEFYRSRCDKHLELEKENERGIHEA
ncbi:E3 binding domain-containing protein [Lacinutrix neustonica]|uniref:E3 binding domain-containing protein n=1 Tax=Lacinutrix neustonica TaxID=2980107 RepID=A0A9E8SEF4_9FLAO|nr:biotin/lipoyl-containing protein [Lacinutrix neustonica]WAC03498.1 E3 binding domain-containing protein [Lacinutrix neustonica]